MFQDSNLEQQLIVHEGIKKSAYQDSNGYWTIGIGFCIDERLKDGLSIDECMTILRMRINNLDKSLSQYSWYTKQDEVRKGVLIELAYNMGLPKLLKFDTFLGLMGERKVTAAALDLSGTLWAKQVGKGRLNDILKRIREGSYTK